MSVSVILQRLGRWKKFLSCVLACLLIGMLVVYERQYDVAASLQSQFISSYQQTQSSVYRLDEHSDNIISFETDRRVDNSIPDPEQQQQQHQQQQTRFIKTNEQIPTSIPNPGQQIRLINKDEQIKNSIPDPEQQTRFVNSDEPSINDSGKQNSNIPNDEQVNPLLSDTGQQTILTTKDGIHTPPPVADSDPGPQNPRIEGKEPFVNFRNRFNATFSAHGSMGRDNVSDSDRYFIYRCDKYARKLSFCGGWADRVKGMLAAYVIANLTGRVFKIDKQILPSCRMENFLLPNQVNWSLPVSIHKNLNNDPDIMKWNVLSSVRFADSVKTADFFALEQMKSKYVYFISNLDYLVNFGKSERYKSQLAWMKNLTNDQVNAAIFKRLFKPAPLIQNKVSTFLNKNLNPSDKLVCIHLRTGRNPSIPKDSAVRLTPEDLPKIWSSLTNITKDLGPHKIFIMSDSTEVVAEAYQQPFKDKLIYNQEGKIVHVERSKKVSDEDKCDGTETVIMEQLLLMHCDVLVISKSGLSRMAAYVRGSDEGLYCTLIGGIVVPCQASKIQSLYNIPG